MTHRVNRSSSECLEAFEIATTNVSPFHFCRGVGTSSQRILASLTLTHASMHCSLVAAGSAWRRRGWDHFDTDFRQKLRIEKFEGACGSGRMDPITKSEEFVKLVSRACRRKT